MQEGGCKWYPCLFPTCPTLRPLHPGQPGRVGVPWELDRTGRREQHGGQAFSCSEKERNQIQEKSPSIYCIPHLSRATSWKESSYRATVQWAQEGQDRRSERREKLTMTTPLPYLCVFYYWQLCVPWLKSLLFITLCSLILRQSIWIQHVIIPSTWTPYILQCRVE